MTAPTGWYVGVTTKEVLHGEPVTMLYLGCAIPKDAEDAVRKERAIEGEQYNAVDMAVLGIGPQPELGEVRLLKGAV